MRKISMLLALMLSSVWSAWAEECPIRNYDDVVIFCTDANGLGITFPVSSEYNPFDYVFSKYGIIDYYGTVKDEFYEEFVNAYNGECPCFGTAPIEVVRWLMMRVKHDGDMVLNLSHSAYEDIDYACWGPFYGETKKEVLDNICGDLPSSFSFVKQYERPSAAELEKCPYLKRYYEIEDSVRNVLDSTPYLSLFELEELADVIDTYRREMYENRYMYDTDDPCYRGNFDSYPYKKLVDCSFSTLGIETCVIPNAKEGEWYLFMVNNFSYVQGDVSISQIGGSGGIDCSLIVDISNSGPYCEGEDIQLKVLNSPANATFSWTGPNGFHSTARNPVIPDSKHTDSGTYSFQMTVNGMTSDVIETKVEVYKDESRDSVAYISLGDVISYGNAAIASPGEYNVPLTSGCGTLHLTVYPKDMEVNIVTETPICEGEDMILSTDKTLEDYEACWEGPNNFSATGWVANVPKADIRYSGAYKLLLVKNGTKQKVDEKSVKVIQTFRSDTTVVINVGEEFEFFGDMLAKSGVYTHEWTSSEGCDSLYVVKLIVDADPKPSEFFSPNGDGENDTWTIENIEAVSNVTIRIFDRYGKLIREFLNYTNESGWDGTDINGNPLPSSDYWYTINIELLDKLLSGHVTLIR